LRAPRAFFTPPLEFLLPTINFGFTPMLTPTPPPHTTPWENGLATALDTGTLVADDQKKNETNTTEKNQKPVRHNRPKGKIGN